MTIHKARITDAAHIARVHVSGWRHAYAGLLPAEFLQGLSCERRMQDWIGLLAAEKACVLVAKQDDGMVVGFISGTCVDGQAIVGGLYVEPALVGTGIGHALLAAFDQMLAPQVCTLYVLKGNARAIRFYERHGFERTGHCKELRINGACCEELELRRYYGGFVGQR